MGLSIWNGTRAGVPDAQVLVLSDVGQQAPAPGYARVTEPGSKRSIVREPLVAHAANTPPAESEIVPNVATRAATLSAGAEEPQPTRLLGH